MSNTEKIFLTHGNNSYEYKVDDYDGVEPEFLITDPKMSRETWLTRMLKKLPLECLPDNLRPRYQRGIQPPKFYFGFPLEVAELHEMALKHDVPEYFTEYNKYYAESYKEFVEFDEAVDPPTSPIKCLNAQRILEGLGEKMATDLGIPCKPRLEVVLHGALSRSIPLVYFLTSYDKSWKCVPEELNSLVVDYLGLKDSMKWFVDYEVSTWYTSVLR